MKHVEPVQHDDNALFAEIAQSRAAAAPLVRRDLRRLAARFAEYRDLCTATSPLGATIYPNDPEKAAFIRLYETPPKCARSLKNEIRALEGDVCLYCGGVSQPEIIDHFLEKALFPEFSLFSLNLVPSCSRCNSLTGHHFDGIIKRVHPYIYRFCSKQVLRCRISRIEGKPLFSISVEAAELKRAELRLAKRHVEHLQIQARFGKFAGGELRRLKRRLGSSRRLSVTFVKQDLRREYRSWIIYGPNHWRCILIRAILDSDSEVDRLREP